MASTDNKPAFRLPWQSGHAAPSDGEPAAATAVAPAPAWPSSDLARRRTGQAPPADASGKTQAGATTDATATTNASAATHPSPTTEHPGSSATTAPDAADEPAATRSDMTETATPAAAEATDLKARRPKFLADLTRAMRQAADEARQSTMAQFQADVERHTAEARETCETAATDARRRADDDITALGEWETAEIARIRRETEEGITARHGKLETELAAQTVQLEAELARVSGQVDAFAAQMETFFQRLNQEEDPARFAGLAEQMPEAPAFVAWSVAPTTSAELEIWSHDTASDAATSEAAATAAIADARDTHGTAAEAADAATADAEQWASDASAAHDPDAGMPPMQQSDFAAAEAEAADWTDDQPTSAELSPAEAETTAEDTTADAESTAAPEVAETPAQQWPTPATPARPTTTRTQVAVVGLVSVASIATFKRMLGRVQGVHGVQVSSGPDGEFLFNVTHDADLDMPKACTSVQGFEVEVVESGPGIVSCRAVDPEVV